jgi:hypothetical protein
MTPSDDGVYTVTIPGEGTAENVVLLEGEEYVFFVDENTNGVRDDGEETISIDEVSVELEVADDEEIFKVTLNQGLNYRSFEHLPIKTDSCELIKELNKDTVALVTLIARFESGDFEVTSYREDTEDPVSGSCFPVVPGRGYVIRALSDVGEVSLAGYRLTKPAGVAFQNPGWHLIGVNGAGKSYTASSVIDAIDAVNEDIDADNVTRWAEDRSIYMGLQKEADEGGEMQTYGFDFPVEGQKAYFVRIVTGSGVWNPE